MNEDRINRIMAKLAEGGISQALLSDPYSISYITGEVQRPGERFLGLVLRAGKQPKLVLNKLFKTEAVNDDEIIWYDDTIRGALEIIPLLDRSGVLGVDKKLASEFLLELQEAGAAASYANASPYVDRVRMVKDSDEIAKMESVSLMNDEAMLRIKAEVREGVTEIELAKRLSEIYAEIGAEGLSFNSIVSFGANAADPHHSPDGTVLKKGSCVLFDIGCIKNGYCSDMTRTYYFGSVTDEERKIYEVTKLANETAESMIKPGVRFCDIDAAARDIITEAGYGAHFTHRLGHCIGQQGHEWGDVGQKNTDTVSPGMIFSCEPGIYLAGNTGVRIEDLCLVTETGVKILNYVSKELEIIEAE